MPEDRETDCPGDRDLLHVPVLGGGAGDVLVSPGIEYIVLLYIVTIITRNPSRGSLSRIPPSLDLVKLSVRDDGSGREREASDN